MIATSAPARRSPDTGGAPLTAGRRFDEGKTAEPEGYVYDLPSAETVDRLIGWYEALAARDGRLALSLDAEGLGIAADANRRRVATYRQTTACLKALRERGCRPETEFRGHLQAKARPKARVRAPP